MLLAFGSPLRAVGDSVADVTETHPGATVDTDIPADMTLYLDPEPLRLALQHLLENGIVHNDREQPRLDVTASVVSEDAWPRRAPSG